MNTEKRIEELEKLVRDMAEVLGNELAYPTPAASRKLVKRAAKILTK